ncbi:MAG: hypothetical protein AAGC43_17050 [Bacteroidota bacterium]
MKKPILFLLFALSAFSSCKDLSTEKQSNEVPEYYADNSKQLYKRKLKFKEYDSVFYYYDNGQLFKKGIQKKNGKRFGIWKLHSKNGNIREIREWFVIKGHSRINRAWFLDEKGDTLAWRHQDSIFDQKEFVHDTIGERATCYDLIYFRKDTLELDESLKAYAYFRSPLLDEQDSQAMVLIAKSKTNFNDDFSNEKEVELDTFYNLTIDTINQKWFRGVEKKYFTVFGYYFDTPGEKLLRGYMLEYATGEFEDGIDSLTSKKYFEKKIFVRDTIK